LDCRIASARGPNLPPEPRAVATQSGGIENELLELELLELELLELLELELLELELELLELLELEGSLDDDDDGPGAPGSACGVADPSGYSGTRCGRQNST
jgi:hypothetical protein